MGASDQKKHNRVSFSTKRCPECFVDLPLEATHCPVCSQKVKGVNKHGVAKRPINWSAYFICFLSWLGFGFYIWWAFFREGD